MHFTFNKREADALGTEPIFDGTPEELQSEITNAYYVWDDAPFPYWEKEKHMKVLERLAKKHGLKIGL